MRENGLTSWCFHGRHDRCAYRPGGRFDCPCECHTTPGQMDLFTERQPAISYTGYGESLGELIDLPLSIDITSERLQAYLAFIRDKQAQFGLRPDAQIRWRETTCELETV